MKNRMKALLMLVAAVLVMPCLALASSVSTTYSTNWGDGLAAAIALSLGGLALGVTINPFTGTGFDLQTMTAAINKIPNQWGRLEELGMFAVNPVSTTAVSIESMEGTLNIVRSRPRGAPADYAIHDKRTMRAFNIPYFPLDDVLLPEDFQNVRAFNTEDQMETMAGILFRRMTRLRGNMDQTLEFIRMGALKGIVLDADGTTLHNLYTEFGITAKTVDFELDVATTDVIKKTSEVALHIEISLKGERMNGIHALVSPEFFDALSTHPSVVESFRYFQTNNQNMAGDYRRRFVFGAMTFEEYVASWTDKDGNVRKAIAANEGHAFPTGTGETFTTIVAPGNFLETANTLGQLYYAKQEPRKFNQGLDIHTEMNALPIVRRPEVLVKITI